MAADPQDIAKRLSAAIIKLIQAQETNANTTNLNAEVARLNLELKQAEHDRYQQARFYNKWRNYRNPNRDDLRADEVTRKMRWLQNQSYVSYAIQWPGSAPPAFVPHRDWGEALRPYRVPPNPPGLQAFLDRSVPDLSPHWKGTRILGAGSSGKVGLFEYRGPPGQNSLPVSRVAIKEVVETAPASLELKSEGEMLLKLGQTLSPHVVCALVLHHMHTYLRKGCTHKSGAVNQEFLTPATSCLLTFALFR
jgi:hypothetical protein